MNFRVTMLFFALLLAMLWVFGLMIAHKRATGEQGFVLKVPKDAKINKVIVKASEAGKAEEAEFVQIDDRWFLKSGKQQARIEGVRVQENIIAQLQRAKPDETADVSKEPKFYGLQPPRMVVTLAGTLKGEDKQWEFFIGNESPDQSFVYVSSSDWPNRVFAVSKTDIDGVFFKSPNFLRSKRLWDFGEAGVNKIFVKKDKVEPLEIVRTEAALWNIVQPPLGIAGFTDVGPEEEKKKDPFKKKDEPEPPATATGVKGFLNNIIALRVDDEEQLVPLGKPASDYGLDPASNPMRIEITSGEKNEKSKEVLLIATGKTTTVNKVEYYYAKLENDDGVVMINAKLLEPIDKVLKTPGDLRSHDIAAFDAKKADAVFLVETKKDDKSETKIETKFFLQEPEHKEPFADPAPAWQMYRDKKKDKASASAMRTLLDLSLGKKSIVKFLDVDQVKKEPEWGLDAPRVTVSIYSDGIDPAKKEEKKDAKKDDKDKKDDKGKKDKKDEIEVPSIKKDLKPALVLAFGKTEGDHIYVRRTLEDGTTKSWFTVKKEVLEKILPKEGVHLGYLDDALPAATPEQVWAIKLKRPTEKGGAEIVELERRMIDGKWYWHILDKLEPSGAKLADSNKAEQIILTLGSLHARKWHKEIAEKEDLGKYGLTTPTIVATMTVKKHPYTARGAGAAVAAALHRSPLPFATSLLADFLADPGEAVTIEFGKEDKEDKEKFTYAKHSGRNLLFSVDSDRPDFVKKQDLRDRTFQMYAHALRGISFVTMSGVDPISLLNFASPHITGRALEFDPEKVTKINLSVRTAYELRTFQFDRIAKEKPKEPEKTKVDDKGKEQPKEAGKDKEQPKDAGKDKEQPKDKGKVAAKDDEKKESPWTWTDKSNIPEFQLDPEKVAQFLKDTSKLETNRFVVFAGGPRGEHKLDAKEATIKLDLLMDNGKTITLLVGASYLGHGYFATSNVWSDADGKLSTVFFLSPNFVMPILSGTDYFGKQRIAAD